MFSLQGSLLPLKHILHVSLFFRYFSLGCLLRYDYFTELSLLLFLPLVRIRIFFNCINLSNDMLGVYCGIICSTVWSRAFLK